MSAMVAKRLLHRVYRALIGTATAASSLSAHAADEPPKFPITLLQPDWMLQQRVPSVPLLVAYIKSVEIQFMAVLKRHPPLPPTSGYLVIAIRPGQQSNAWLDYEPALPSAVSKEVVQSVRSVMPPSVRGGPVAFAVKMGLSGGVAPLEAMRAPAEWKAVAERAGRPLEVDELVERAWRE